MMASFADLIQEIDKRYSPGPKAPQLVQETFRLVTDQPGGAEGLLERCKAAGLAVEVASWSDGLDPVPLSGQEVEQTLGPDIIGALADKIGLNPNFVRTILGYALPEIIMLAKSGAVPPEIPDSDAESPNPLFRFRRPPPKPFRRRKQRPFKRAKGYSFPLPHQGCRRVSNNSPLQVRCWRLLFLVWLGRGGIFPVVPHRGRAPGGQRRKWPRTSGPSKPASRLCAPRRASLRRTPPRLQI